jgi:hypothetical protein
MAGHWVGRMRVIETGGDSSRPSVSSGMTDNVARARTRVVVAHERNTGTNAALGRPRSR